MDKKVRNWIIGSVIVVVAVVVIVLASWGQMTKVNMNFAYNASLYLPGEGGNFSMTMSEDACAKLREVFDGCKKLDESPYEEELKDYAIILFADGQAHFYVAANGDHYAYWVEKGVYMELDAERYELLRSVVRQYGLKLPE